MMASVGRSLVMVAAAMMGADRRSWSLAMEVEYEFAAEDGRALAFATGCLATAGRELITSERGRFALMSHAVALGIMVPIGTMQIGCALFGLPYLFPGQHGLAGALLEGSAHEPLVRSIYLAAVPTLALIQLIAALGQLRLAWVFLNRDWDGTLRWSLWTMASMTALILFMSVLFLNSSQALVQFGVVGIEMMILVVASRRQAELNHSYG